MDEIVIRSEPLTGLNLVIADKIYDRARTCLVEIFTNPSIDDTILILKTLTTVASLLEVTQINGTKKVKGSDKKKIVVYVSKKLVGECVQFFDMQRVSTLFEKNSDELIEIFIDFAKNNKLVEKIKIPCTFSC